jgi:uncharacterized PurR-regulated membrane protein YhhQ (DUF165 family)
MIYIAIYIAAIVAANLSIAHFGVVSAPINAFLFIGLDLALRDRLHERWKNRAVFTRMLGLFSVAGVISYLLNPASGMIAVASLVAFVVASMADTLVYDKLQAKEYFVRCNGSNLAGALVDSIIFPVLAFGGFPVGVIATQFAAKFWGGFVWSLILQGRSR